MSDLFDFTFDASLAPAPTRRRLPEAPIPDTESPFGASMPTGYQRGEGTTEEGDSLSCVRFLTGGISGGDAEKVAVQKAKRYDPRNHYPRTYKALEGIFPGGFFWRADYTQVTYSGQTISKDTLGFADVMGMDATGRIIAAQVTSYGSIGAHLRKYTDPKKTHGSGANPPSIESLLRRFLGCGGRLLIFGFVLPEGQRFWEHELVEVTPALLDEYKGRKRGPKK